ncbi:MAG TPA: 3-hydroxyacyl-CoA dehydrogenase family protein, partial [Dehalococcoidia bacterium]|nr:3-hydroxyacyl-CoA dehydrogenase family protein [Dehalococcoidia bacterium]
LREAMSIVEEGLATALQVDEIVRQGFGIESSQVGIFEKIASATAAGEQMASKETFSQLNSDRELPRVLLEKIESNDLGVKVGRGFYEWTPESAEKWRKNMADSLLHMG